MKTTPLNKAEATGRRGHAHKGNSAAIAAASCSFVRCGIDNHPSQLTPESMIRRQSERSCNGRFVDSRGSADGKLRCAAARVDADCRAGLATDAGRSGGKAGVGLGAVVNGPIVTRRGLFGSLLTASFGMLLPRTARAWMGYNFSNLKSLLARNRLDGVRVLDGSGHFVGCRGAYYAPAAPYPKLPRYLLLAVVAQEDRRFFSGSWLRIGGLDLWSIARAAAADIAHGRVSEGGSTIPQQVIKTIYLGNTNKYIRKVGEILLTPGLSRSLSDVDLLYLYLNRIYFGNGAYGIEAASTVYFEKAAHELTLLEIVLLVQSIPAPSKRNLRVDYEGALDRAQKLLRAYLGRFAFRQVIMASAKWSMAR
jgi:hypothetical protein